MREGYAGLSEPLGLFTSEEAAKKWAYDEDAKNYTNHYKKLFIDMFYTNYWLEEIEVKG